MSKSNDHASFSFALSETPPPVRSAEESPLGDLDLDLGDFGDVLDASESPSESRLGSASPEPVAPRQTKGAVPGSFFDPFQVPSTSEPKEQTVHAPAEPRPSTEAPELLGFDLTPVGSLEAETPLVSVRSEAALLKSPAAGFSEEPAEASSEEPAEASSVGKLAPSVTKPAPSVTKPASTVGKPRKAAAPTLKKIQFPTPGAKPEKASQTGRGPERPTTRFSESIAPSSVRAKFDSESESQDEESGELTLGEIVETGVPPQADVEDLPDTLARSAGDTGWSAETPTAREIWKAARKTWGVTSKHALALGGQGLRAGRVLARETNEKLRARLAEGAKKAASEAQDAEGELPFPHAPPSGGASVTGRVILGLARSTGKKLAAPLSAVAAAALVYLGGTHLLGTTGSFALSKSTPAVNVPDLGSLPEEGKAQPQTGARSEAGPAPGEKVAVTTQAVPTGGKAPAMQSEVTDMPDGLSWPGKGLIEVVTSEEELIYVDGVFTGRGPLRRIPVSPGEHEVSIRSGGVERTGVVQVSANRNTRAVFSSH